jgi:hypothetical protein
MFQKVVEAAIQDSNFFESDQQAKYNLRPANTNSGVVFKSAVARPQRSRSASTCLLRIEMTRCELSATQSGSRPQFQNIPYCGSSDGLAVLDTANTDINVSSKSICLSLISACSCSGPRQRGGHRSRWMICLFRACLRLTDVATARCPTSSTTRALSRSTRSSVLETDGSCRREGVI